MKRVVSLPALTWFLSLIIPSLSRNLFVDYFMTSETQYLNSRCCKSDNTDLIVIHPESSLENTESLFLNFTINRNLLRHTREKSLCSAELRLYQQGQSTRQPQRIEVLLRGLYVLDSKQLGQNVRGWKNFNVYDAFIDDNSLPEELVKDTRNKVLIRFEVRPHKLDLQKNLLPHFKSGIIGEHKPRIFLKSCRQSKRKVVNNFTRRYDNARTPASKFNEPSYWLSPDDQDEGKCGVRLLYLQFDKDMSIPSIRAPQGVYVNYCSGSCPYLWKTEDPPLHTLILGQYAEQIRESVYEPCCVPAKYEAAEAITVENQIIKFDDLRVTSCKCV
ncbi:transforming growth factor beta-1 proprotein-like isoform X2 [Bolinopsis microptera]|uniref:transforming growth factor beta-1 proprotein-like isoform X2 n=1 Tax=Bolinopsis microptera TaxID=2820187 RepID=UPI00307AB98B